jgi:hypothetical protein
MALEVFRELHLRQRPEQGVRRPFYGIAISRQVPYRITFAFRAIRLEGATDALLRTLAA